MAITRAMIVAMSGLLAASGCAQFNLSKAIPWSKTDSKQLETPQRVVAVWSETHMHPPGQEVVRGFGGRLLFFGSDANRPVEVEGKLIVYAFDESAVPPTNTAAAPKLDGAATRKYIFEQNQLASHYSVSKLGPSYSFWVPWEKLAKTQQVITLVPYFVTTEGQIIAGEPTRNVLAGEIPAIEPAKVQQFTSTPTVAAVTGPGSVAAGNVQQATYQTDAAGQKLMMKTTTIPISPTLARGFGPSPTTQPQTGASTAGNTTVTTLPEGSTGQPLPGQPLPGQPATSGNATITYPQTTYGAPRMAREEVRGEVRERLETTPVDGSTGSRPASIAPGSPARSEPGQSPAPSGASARPGPWRGSWGQYRGGLPSATLAPPTLSNLRASSTNE